MTDQIKALEKEIYEKTVQLGQLQKDNAGVEVKNYEFTTTNGKVSLLEMFEDKDQLFVIHNMGKGCRYCTLWADGLNGFLPHLESQFSVYLVSKNTPDDMRRMANERGWRYKLASHGGGAYIKEQSVGSEGQDNYPGMVCYEKKGDKIFKKNITAFGPGDLFCSFWNILSLAGQNPETFTPQFSYWKRPEKMDDGGQNLQ